MLFLREFWVFGLKQAYACMFGGYLLLLIVVTKLWYPENEFLYRYDFLFLAALVFQIAMLVLKLETLREALVILVFHLVATGMEIFKTSDAIGSWEYPESFNLSVFGVPLFVGFMYSAVGSYIARIWRLFDFQFSYYPNKYFSWMLVFLIYLNFFTHHYTYDIRVFLLVLTVILFFKCFVFFRVLDVYRSMPLLLGWLLVAFFIWFAENVATYFNIWIYPSQKDGWHMVSLSKWMAWFLLMILSFVLVSIVQKPRIRKNS